MRNSLLFIAAFLMFTACKKKVDSSQHCYNCVTTDSVSSNIPALVNGKYSTQNGYICKYTEDQKNYYVKTHTKTDTLYFKNDTLQLNHFVTSCTIDY